MKNADFWDMAPCRSYVNRRYGGTYRLHLRSRKIHLVPFPPDNDPIAALACSLLAHLYRRYPSPLY
jgi:hypothetical protein